MIFIMIIHCSRKDESLSLVRSKYNISIAQFKKVIPTLNNKEKYVLHSRNLQLYIDLCLKVTKVHRVLEFDQLPWLKQYIDFNTQKRTNAKKFYYYLANCMLTHWIYPYYQGVPFALPFSTK